MRHILTLLFLPCFSLLGADAMGMRIGAPMPLSSFTSSPGFTNVAIDAATKKLGWTFQADEAAVVTSLLFRQASRTGSPGDYKISLQTNSTTTANPTGTVLAAGLYSPAADTDTIKAVTISHDGAGSSISSYTLTKGAIYTIVLEPCLDSTAPCGGAATVDASNMITVTSRLQSFVSAGRTAFPYANVYSTTWSPAADYPVFGYRSASKSYGFPLQSFAITGVSSGDEFAVSFNLPSTMLSTYKVKGVRLLGTSAATTKTFKLVQYDSGTTAQYSTTFDSDQFRIVSTTYVQMELLFSNSTAALSAGTTYRIGISPQEASNNIAVLTLTFATAGDKNAIPGGSLFGYSTRTGCGAACDTTSTAWSDSTVTRPAMELILEDITAPAGGGGAPTSHTFVQ